MKKIEARNRRARKLRSLSEGLNVNRLSIFRSVSYTHLRAHETLRHLVCRLLLEKKLEINGVGYRVKVSGANLELSLGYSHPINYKLPDGVTAEAPTNTELVLTSTNKQLLGDTASEIRAFRPPEPYKGKGVKYSDEHIKRKESKKTA